MNIGNYNDYLKELESRKRKELESQLKDCFSLIYFIESKLKNKE